MSRLLGSKLCGNYSVFFPKGRRQIVCFLKKNAARKRKKISSSKQNKRSDEKRYQIDNLSEDYLVAVAELEAGMRKKPALELYKVKEIETARRFVLFPKRPHSFKRTIFVCLRIKQQLHLINLLSSRRREEHRVH